MTTHILLIINMEILLVRHGQTEGNVAHRHQALSTPLTEHGRAQIREAASQLKAMKPTRLLTSPVFRAVESAQIIGQALDMTPETSPLFVELERPVFLNGNFHKSISSLWFYTRWYVGLADNTKHGGESYKMIRERIERAQMLLEQYPPDSRIVVVSHSVFINFFLAHACNKKPLNPFQALARFLKVLSIKNGCIIKVYFDPAPNGKVCKWRVED
jgi:broad specificity phosphatase PhoE